MIDILTLVILRFNDVLRSKIIEILRQKQAHLSYPNESTIALCQPWSSNSTIYLL